jgi:hypothetical protein
LFGSGSPSFLPFCYAHQWLEGCQQRWQGCSVTVTLHISMRCRVDLKGMSLTIQAHQVFCALTNRKFAACVVAAHDFGPMPIERSMAWTWDGTRGDIRAYLPILHLTHFWHWGGLATLIFGPVSDYIGRRKVFLFLQLLLVLSTTCCACVLATCLCWLRMVVRGYWARGCGS